MGDKYPWDTSPKTIWEKISRNPPDTDHYQKLAMLAQLKTADALASYTKWLVVVTAILAVCAVREIVIAIFGR